MDPQNAKIEARAYQLFQERMGKGSAPLDDWLRAEFEVKNGSVMDAQSAVAGLVISELAKRNIIGSKK